MQVLLCMCLFLREACTMTCVAVPGKGCKGVYGCAGARHTHPSVVHPQSWGHLATSAWRSLGQSPCVQFWSGLQVSLPAVQQLCLHRSCLNLCMCSTCSAALLLCMLHLCMLFLRELHLPCSETTVTTDGVQADAKRTRMCLLTCRSWLACCWLTCLLLAGWLAAGWLACQLSPTVRPVSLSDMNRSWQPTQIFRIVLHC